MNEKPASPGETVRLILSPSMTGEDAGWYPADDDDELKPWERERLFEVPAAQLERWKLAEAAWGAAKREINDLIKNRERGR